MDMQTERGELRERFLRFTSSLNGKMVHVAMHENTEVSGKMVAVKGDGSHFLVGGLVTPIGVQDIAALRTSDTACVSVTFDDLCSKN